MSTSYVRSALIAAFVTLSAQPASTRADGVYPYPILTLDEQPKAEEPAVPTGGFAPRNRWTAEVLGTCIGDLSNRHVVMGGATAGVGYYVTENIAIMLDGSGYGFSEGRSSGAAVGVTLGLRHHIFAVGKGSVFIDFSGGIIEASNNLPYRGSHLNNSVEAGLGVAYPIGHDVYFLTGVRYYHLSNADNHGPDRNPSVNGLQGVMGIMWRF